MLNNLIFVIRNLTGNIDKRILEKFAKEAKEMNRESWYFSWALDTNQDERAKGITVECGIATFEMPNRKFTILDAPGHKNYVPNMIAGAAQADIAVLIVSARKGEFETGFEKGGQTREHLYLVKTFGLKKLIVLVNKMDDPTVRWSKARYDEILEKLSPYIKHLGYLKSDVEYLPVSGFEGVNLLGPIDKTKCDWYDGPSFLQLLDTIPLPERKIDAPFLMPISGKYKDLGTVITGKIENGVIRKGDTIMVMPNKVLFSVKISFRN